MKRLTKILSLAALATTLTSLPLNSLLAAPVEIKFSHVVAPNTPKGKMAIKFKQLVEQRLPGKVIVKVYPNSQLFTDSKVLEAMLLGDVQIAAPSLSKFQKYTKKLQIFDLPFLFKDMNAVDKFQQGPEGKQLLKSLEKKMLVGLGYLHNGMKQMSANTPISVPGDIAGKKFRIQTSNVLQAQFEAVNAIPLKKPFSEVFTLLQTRAIDGQENTWSNMYSKKFFEVQDYISETNHGLLDYLVVASAEFWYGLPEDQRTIIAQSMDEAIAYGNTVARQKSFADRELIFKQSDTQLVEINDQQRQQWVSAMTPVWKLFEKQIGKNLIDAAIASNQ